ncbi:MAG: hypothetical protein ACOC1O_01880 [bacterium]
MKIKEVAFNDLEGTDFVNGALSNYTNVNFKDWIYNNIGNESITFTFINESDMQELEGVVVDKRVEHIVDEYKEINGNEKCFVVKSGNDKFLIPLFEIEDNLNDIIFNRIKEGNAPFNLDKFIENNYQHLKDLEKFDFLSNTKFGIELEGRWNGSLNLEGFSRTTDNSFDDSYKVRDYDNNDEFVYNGCDKAPIVLEKLFKAYPKLETADFNYTRDCGSHIHFSQFGKKSRSFNELDFMKITTILISIEDILFDIIPQYRVGTVDKLNGDVLSNEGGYSKSVYHRTDDFLRTMEEIKYQLSKGTLEKNMEKYKDKLINSWYKEHYPERNQKYNITRYFGINLHSYFYRGSLELRYFEGNYKNLPYYMDLVDKIVYMVENVEWEKINRLLEKLDSYNKVATKSSALLYALGVSNMTLSKLLSRTDYTQLNIVKSHSLLNEIRENMTTKEVELSIPADREQEEIFDTTCFEEDIDKSLDYKSDKARIVEKIKAKKGDLSQIDFDEIITEEFTGQDNEEFDDYLNRISRTM